MQLSEFISDGSPTRAEDFCWEACACAAGFGVATLTSFLVWFGIGEYCGLPKFFTHHHRYAGFGQGRSGVPWLRDMDSRDLRLRGETGGTSCLALLFHSRPQLTKGALLFRLSLAVGCLRSRNLCRLSSHLCDLLSA